MQAFRCIPWGGRGQDLLMTGLWRGEESAVPLRIAVRASGWLVTTCPEMGQTQGDGAGEEK